MITTAPIVGMHFRPPAKNIVAALPSGYPLLIEAEPSNQYDPKAVKVLVDLTDAGPDFWEEMPEAVLENFGSSKEELLSSPRHIAYIDKAKTGSAAQVFDALADGKTATCVIGLNGDGNPLIHLQWTE